jgi:hypothetical protein
LKAGLAFAFKLEALGRFELPTCGLGNRRSIHLSYRAMMPILTCLPLMGNLPGDEIQLVVPHSPAGGMTPYLEETQSFAYLPLPALPATAACRLRFRNRQKDRAQIVRSVLSFSTK